jgi:orotidine-5'-phosphate decarboxylase
MTEPSTAAAVKPQSRERIIVALDVETAAEARFIVSELKGEVGAFKIGLQLFTSAGPQIVSEIVGSGARVFLDLKFHDIPNTVAKAAVEAARLGVWMFNVHALGGREMMRRTVNEVGSFCETESIEKPLVIAVTVLTSSNANTLSEVGIEREVDTEVLKLAKLTAECGLDGVVASPLEAGMIRNSGLGSEFAIVTPGIRPESATNDDQKRVMTPSEALANGSDYLVIGRPIIKADNRVSAVQKVLEEIEAGPQ